LIINAITSIIRLMCSLSALSYGRFLLVKSHMLICTMVQLLVRSFSLFFATLFAAV